MNEGGGSGGSGGSGASAGEGAMDTEGSSLPSREKEREEEREVTLAMLEDGGGVSAHAQHVVGPYPSLLLGFLVAEDACLAADVKGRMGGGTLQPLVEAVQEFKAFLQGMGALTEEQGDVLGGLVAGLSKC